MPQQQQSTRPAPLHYTVHASTNSNRSQIACLDENESKMEETLQKVREFWYDSYNIETTWYAFYIPLCFWVTCWSYARITRRDFFGLTPLHLIHHVGAMVLASISLYYDDNSIMNERVPILWSVAYFTVDIVEATSKLHLTYILHGAIALGLGLGNYNIPMLRQLRMNSKASYIEASSLLLPYVKRYRKPWLFFIFALVYTVCRIVWIPFIIKELLIKGMRPTHPSIIGVSVFYCLNIHWYIKIIKIALKGSGKEKDQKDQNKSKGKKE